MQVFSKVHSFAGVTAFWTHEKYSDSTIISSVGRDGHLRYWKVCTKSETMIKMRCEILPTKWPFIITYSNVHGLLICGFKEVINFYVKYLYLMSIIYLFFRTI